MLLLFWNPSGAAPPPPFIPAAPAVAAYAGLSATDPRGSGYLIPPQWGGTPIRGGWQSSSAVDAVEPVELRTNRIEELLKQQRQRKRKRAEALALALLMLEDV